MAKNNKNLVWWLILGLVIAFVFLPKSGFLGSLLTVCDNTEPASFASFANVTAANPTTLEITNGTATFPTNSQGALRIVNIGSENCANLLQLINGTKGAYGLHETIIKNGQVYWCGKNGATLLYTTDPNELANYYAKYEVCRTQNYTGTAYEADPAVCVQKFGNWTNNKCMCPDATQLKINDECEQPREITPILTPNITAPVKTTTTIPKATTPTTTTPTTPTPDRTTTYVLGGLAVVALAYFGYTMYKKKRR